MYVIYEIIGWSGTGLILLAYFLVSAGKVSPSSRNYRLLNLFGALGIIINSGIHGAIPAIGLNMAWLLIALYGLLKAKK